MSYTKNSETNNKTYTKTTNNFKGNKYDNKTSKYNKTKKVEHYTTTKNVQSEDNQKIIQKAGRTLLVKSVSGNSIDTSVFDTLVGLVSKSETLSSNSYFLTFDDVTNAVNAFNNLNADTSNYKVKFSYYRVFFTISGLTDTSDYNQVKQDFVTFVGNKTKSIVLFFKLYRKNDKYLGCGDFTLDTITGMNTLLSKENGQKEFTLGQYSGTFYRYNGKKEKTDEQNEHS
jgi:hypothetical protein